MIDICDSEAIFKLSKRRKIENSWTLECTHIIRENRWASCCQVVKCPTGPSNARPGRQIPAYTDVALSQMLWGCPGGGADRGWMTIWKPGIKVIQILSRVI
jgi:hypothetical protein